MLCRQAVIVTRQHGFIKGQCKQIVRVGHLAVLLSAAAACLQIHRQFRKPLIVMSPKNLLRHPEAKSGLWEFDDVADDKGILGVRFKRVIMDESVSDRWGLGCWHAEHATAVTGLCRNRCLTGWSQLPLKDPACSFLMPPSFGWLRYP